MEVFKVITVSFEDYKKLVTVVVHSNHMTNDSSLDLDSLLSSILNPLDHVKSKD